MKFPSVFPAVFAAVVFCDPAFSQSVAVGTNLLPLAFEDAGLPQATRERIAADLSEAFEWAAGPEEAFETDPTAETGVGHVREPFDLSIPSDLWDGACLTNGVDGLRCRVAKTLSDAHAARLAAFSGFDAQLDALRTRIRAANADGFDALSVQEKADFFWRGGTVPANPTQEQTAAFGNEIVPLLRDYVVHPPSLFRLEEGKTMDGETATLCGWCVFVPRAGTGRTIRAVPVGLVGDQWKFYFGM